MFGSLFVGSRCNRLTLTWCARCCCCCCSSWIQKNILNFRPPVSRLSAPFSILIRCSIATVSSSAVPPASVRARARFTFARVAYFRCPRRAANKTEAENQAKCQGKKIQLASSLSTHKYRTLHTHTHTHPVAMHGVQCDWRQRPFNYKYISNNKAPSIVHAYILVHTHTYIHSRYIVTLDTAGRRCLLPRCSLPLSFLRRRGSRAPVQS